MNKTELILNDISNALYGLLDADALPNIMGEECPSISVKDMKSNMDVLSFEHSVSLWNVDMSQWVLNASMTYWTLPE